MNAEASQTLMLIDHLCLQKGEERSLSDYERKTVTVK